MTNFKRFLLDDLRTWKSSDNRKPLILRGARQTGKTTLVKQFGQEFSNFIYLNLEKKEDADIFENSLKATDLIQYICLEKNTLFDDDTLLFIDEIQNSPKAVQQLRYFFEDVPNLYVIGAGSLLDVMMDRHKISFPVGRIEFRYLFPLSFEEFLDATGEKVALNFYQADEISPLAHNKLRNLFKLYMFVGGMPEAVARYVQTKDLSSLVPVFESLLTSYKDDATKYAKNENEANVIRRIIETAPAEVGNRIKFEKFGNTNYKSREAGEALHKLERAMLCYLRYPVSNTEVPLAENFKLHPRLQFLDTGLLNYALGMTSAFFSADKISNSYRGMIAEHIVGQEILAAQYLTLQKPKFWVKEKKQSNAEVDFLLHRGTNVIPIEVKSGASGSLRSLHSFLDNSSCNFAIRLYDGERKLEKTKTSLGQKDFELLNLPLYYAGKLTKIF